ncbi:MAG: hypothetical protein JW780_01130 [Clostridiales bacterium]|nr:hypothetical protein [Clostridiales bacterium]
MAKKSAPAERKIVRANKSSAESFQDKQTRKSKASGFRVGAVVLWLVAIAFEVLAILLLNGTFYFEFFGIKDQTVWMIVAIVLDLICVIIGSQLWKKSNDIDPASEKNKVKFFLWNNMGVIAAIIALAPLIVLFLKDKKLDPKKKKILTAVAGVVLAIAILFSVDWNPASEEDLLEAQSEIGDGTVYWTAFGKSYHLDPDCHTLSRSSVIYSGTIEEAFDANREDPCDFCALEEAEEIED